MFKNSWNSFYNQDYLKVKETIAPLDGPSRLLNYDFRSINGVTELFFKILLRLFEIVMKILMTFYYFLRDYVYYITQVISLTLSMICIVYWISILVQMKQLGIDIGLTRGDKIGFPDILLFEGLSKLAENYTIYRKLQAVNGIFIVLGVLPYFSVSFKLSLVLHIVRLSKNKVIAYSALFIVIVVGYGISGYLIYGDKITEFVSVPRSILQITISLLGGLNYDSMKLFFPIATPIFVFSFFVSFGLMPGHWVYAFPKTIPHRIRV